jgi:hypothetical protein
MVVAGGTNRVLDPRRTEGGRFIVRRPVILGEESSPNSSLYLFYAVDPANVIHFSYRSDGPRV